MDVVHCKSMTPQLKEKLTDELNTFLKTKNYVRKLKTIKFLHNNTRMRGGSKETSNATPVMVKHAIESARKHGIDISPGLLNKADGNCAFESVILNINARSCFSNKLPLHVNTYRQDWVTQLEKEVSKHPNIARTQILNNKDIWNKLKESGVYDIAFFGDLVMHGIAKGCKKNILIFNTSTDASCPIYVIEASEFGGTVDSDIPVVLVS